MIKKEETVAITQFQELLNAAAKRKAESPFTVGMILDYINDPLNISAETWHLIDKWSNNSRVIDWLKVQSKEGEVREYGIVYDIVHTTSQSGINRIEVKFIDQVGFGGFVYSTTSGNEVVAALQAQEPDGFQIGDLVEMVSSLNDVKSRKKFRGNEAEALEIRLNILASAKEVIDSLNE